MSSHKIMFMKYLSGLSVSLLLAPFADAFVANQPARRSFALNAVPTETKPISSMLYGKKYNSGPKYFLVLENKLYC